MPKTKFTPAKDGFHFANYFINQIANVPGVGALQTAGRCGGMSYCALDHFNAGIALPPFKGSDFGSKGVPPDGHPLADYIYQRQLDSFFTLSAVKLITYTLASDAGNFLIKGITKRTKEEEWKKLKDSIDRGAPVTLGLIIARDLGKLGHNHQVVAYGYDFDEASGKMTVHIYDVNWPNQEITLTSAKGDAGWAESSPGKEQWRGWFVQDYAPRRPPPDLGKLLPGMASAAAAKAISPAGEAAAATPSTSTRRGRVNTVTVTLNRLTFFNPEEPASYAELALEFTINEQTVRWPARGARKVKHGSKAKLDKAIEVKVSSADELVISGRIASSVTLTDTDGFDAFDYFNLDHEAQAGVFRKRFTRADKWGKGEHTVRSEGAAGGYTLDYTIE